MHTVHLIILMRMELRMISSSLALLLLLVDMQTYCIQVPEIIGLTVTILRSLSLTQMDLHH